MKLILILSFACLSTMASYEVVRPYAEYENVGTVIFNSRNVHEEEAIKRTLLENLPSDVEVVITYSAENQSRREVRRNFQEFEQYRDIRYFRVAGASWSRLRWARDYSPIPVHARHSSTGREIIGFVDHHYFGSIEADEQFSRFFDVPIVKSHSKRFEGGNFLADTSGRCFVQSNGRLLLTDNEFALYYGCSQVIRFPSRGGVGHIDEQMKIIDDNIAVTDEEDYAEILRSEGFDVYMLPQARGVRTYANSLLVNGVVFLPIFDEDNDQEAIRVYESLGLEVHAMRGENLSDTLKGNVHCISMVYPDDI